MCPSWVYQRPSKYVVVMEFGASMVHWQLGLPPKRHNISCLLDEFNVIGNLKLIWFFFLWITNQDVMTLPHPRSQAPPWCLPNVLRINVPNHTRLIYRPTPSDRAPLWIPSAWEHPSIQQRKVRASHHGILWHPRRWETTTMMTTISSTPRQSLSR